MILEAKPRRLTSFYAFSLLHLIQIKTSNSKRLTLRGSEVGFLRRCGLVANLLSPAGGEADRFALWHLDEC